MKGILRSLTLGAMAMACGFGFVFVMYGIFDTVDSNQAVSGSKPAKTVQGAPDTVHYVVNLVSGTDPIELATVQHPDALAKYQVYSTHLTIKDTVWHQLRLGFFPDAASAERIVDLLREDYPLARVAQASKREWAERTNAKLVALIAADVVKQPNSNGKPARTEGNRPGGNRARAPSATRVALLAAPETQKPGTSIPGDAPTECDTLTAHPWDPQKLTEGIYWNKVPAARAALACRLAVRDNPSARNMYQYARALAKSKDFSEAAEWYKKSASQGYVQAQYALGDAYEFGEGVQMNFVLAQSWYKKAAAQGFTHAVDRLNRLQHASITNTRQQVASTATPNDPVQ